MLTFRFVLVLMACGLAVGCASSPTPAPTPVQEPTAQPLGVVALATPTSGPAAVVAAIAPEGQAAVQVAPTALPTATEVTLPAGVVLVSVEAPQGVDSGSTFTVRVSVGEVTDFDVGQFDISFDTSVLAIDNITPGVGFTDGSIGGTTIPIAATAQRSAGTVRVVLNVPGVPGVSGSGYLSEVHFRVIGSDGSSSPIDLTNVLLGDNTANEIPSLPQGASVVVGSSDS